MDIDDTLQKIQATIANGLTKNAIEALLGISFTDEQLKFYRKAKAIYDLKLRKRRQERKYEHLSGAAVKRKHDDKYATIDEAIDNARKNINWERRNDSEKSLAKWVQTYCVGILIDEAPPQKGVQVLNEMELALNDARPYMIMMSRGSGKTCYIEAASCYVIATGKRKFPVAISANAKAACNILNDIFRMFQEPDTPFAQDYPDLCIPIQIANGSFRRKQTYRGISTEIAKTANQFQLARLQQEDGTIPKTGCIMATRGITSGIRGLKHHTLRPDLVLLDDLQTSQDAESPIQVEKLLNIIKKDVFNLAGKGKLAILQTATPIAPDDLAERIASDTAWKTTVWPSIIKWPKDIQDNGDKGLWGKYFRMFDSENVDDQSHDKSLQFYIDNQEAMDEGAEVFNPSRFLRSDGHITALQALLEKQHTIGEAAFAAEMQMKPKRYSFQLDISPKVILSRACTSKRLCVPDGYVFVACSTDLNVSYAATTAITAFKTDMTAHVLYHEITPCNIDQKLNDTEYSQSVYNLLVKIGKQIKNLGIKIDGWAIDAGGRNWSAVCSYAKQAMQSCGLPACAFAGRSSNIFNPLVRSRLRDAIGRTVLCGDQAEHIKAGSGQKYVFFDADLHKEMVQKAFLSELGAPGSCSIYDGDSDEHSDFSIQVCNEKLLFVKHAQDGRNHYNWKSFEPHDYLDCMSMCFAVASSQGISGFNINTGLASHKVKRTIKQKPRIRVV